MKRLISKLLAIIMIVNMLPVNIALAETNPINLPIDVKTYDNTGNLIDIIRNGDKSINPETDVIHIKYNNSFKIDENKFDPSKLSDYIKVYVNGKNEDYINHNNNKLKFEFKNDKVNGVIKIGIKEGQSNNTHMKPFILRKHVLYNIKIPEGLFIDNQGRTNREINHTFTTKGDGVYGNDIIKDISPSNNSTGVDYKKGEMIVDFIDEIYLGEHVKNNISNYFELSSTSTIDPNVDGFDSEKLENIKDFDISSNGSKLIIKAKSGKFNDYANYKLNIKVNAVQLKNSKDLINGAIITNSTQSINFTTDNWVHSVNLHTKEGWIPYKIPLGNVENVPTNPLIQVKFKYPVELIDKNKIEFSSDGNVFAIDMDKDSWINYDGNILKLDINGLYRAGKNPLRKDTAYKVTIKKGALKLKGYTSSDTNKQIENKDIDIYFITGNEPTKDVDRGLYVTGYSSNANKSDDITVLENGNKLNKDGSIYIHFNRDIQWNKWDKNVDSNEKALPYFKLYKRPSAYEKGYSEKGVLFDKQFRYNKLRNIITPNREIEDEIPIEYVELFENKIKIKPKYDLVNYNEYRVQMLDKDIVTDFYERKIINNINQKIWTAGNGDISKPTITPSEDITVEEVIEDKNSPNKTYILHGVPRYNNIIDKENEKPIVLYMDKEVIVNPRSNLDTTKPDALLGINLSEGYSEPGKSNINEAIEYYKLEYVKDGNDIKTKISLYPNRELDAGKYYELSIDRDVFVTRNGEKLDKGVKYRFVIEGDKEKGKGIYSITIDRSDGVSETEENRKGNQILYEWFNNDGTLKTNLNFKIKGYNFTEDIENIQFTKIKKYLVKDKKNEDLKDGQLDEHYTEEIIPIESRQPITISKNELDIKFENVTDISGTIGNAAAKKLFGNGKWEDYRSWGEYEIIINFKNNTSTKSIMNNLSPTQNKSTLKIKPGACKIPIPRLISVFPENNESEFDYNELVNLDGVGITGQAYIKLVFSDISSSLKDLINKNELTGYEVLVGSEDVVSRDKEIIVRRGYKTLTVYVPVDIGKFKEKETYNVKFPAGKIACAYGVHTNKEYTWKFTTSYTPDIQKLYEGSVVEDYDEKYPIIIEGIQFFEKVRDVYFRDQNGKMHSAYSVTTNSVNGKQVLEVYLPRGSNRLEVGLYDIILENDRSHTDTLRSGVFSVVEEGKYRPEEDYTIKDYNSGKLIKVNKISSDTLRLKSGYSKLDLDDIMGENTWIRNIRYDEGSLGNIETLSKWANIELTGVSRISSRENDGNILISIGRTPMTISDSLKSKLKGNVIKSDFIQVGGENYELERVKLTIPYKQSNGYNLKVLRYNEKNRRFVEERFTVNNIDKTVEVTSYEKGIFVVIE